MSVAQTILNQIKAGRDVAGHNGGTTLMMCWGARQFIAHNENADHMGALRMRVSGAKFKGLVFIKLMFNDTYTVQFAKMRKGEFDVKREIDNVYCDQLTGLIDQIVESGE